MEADTEACSYIDFYGAWLSVYFLLLSAPHFRLRVLS